MRPTISAMTVLLAGLIISFFLKLYKQRRLMRGLPMPPHHPVLGHLPIFAKIVTSLPPDVHPHTYPHYLRTTYNLGPIFYLDTWPLGDPMLIIAGDPDPANQVTISHSLPKHPTLAKFLEPLGGKKNLVTVEGREWKAWRTIFNPGFASGFLMGLVPGIVEDVEVFGRVLGEWADRGEVVRLEEVATRVTVDVIGRVVLDTKLNSQTSENELVSAFRSQVRWLPETNTLNPFKMYNPIRPLMFWWNGRNMNKYLEKELEKRFASVDGEEKTAKTGKQKHVIDLALETYIEEEKPVKKQGSDETFKKFAIDQIKTFIFAGHDTTSSAICWVYHLLSQHPSALARVRQEHDEVFGTDLALAPALIKSNPHSLNKLPYTLAVIKEVLRLFPPASSVRVGEEGFFVHHNGTSYPTANFMIWPVSHALHHDATLFPSPFSFRPERFLPENLDSIPKGAFRPFEYGPRNCIGQELALLEAKIVCVLTIRRFDIWAVYAEMDQMSGKGWRGGMGRKGKPDTVEGERAYQVLVATAKPAGGMPARVKRTERGEGG